MLLTAAERLQYEGYLRREETNATILALSKSGTSIKQVVRQTGHSRKLVRQVIRGERHDVFRTRQSSLDQHLPWLDDQWAAGCRNGAELWRRLRSRGFRGSLRVVGEWATRRRRPEKVDVENRHRIPSARTIARLITVGRDTLSKAETVTVTAIEAGVPTLVEAREIIAEFHSMIGSLAGGSAKRGKRSLMGAGAVTPSSLPCCALKRRYIAPSSRHPRVRGCDSGT